MSKSKISNRIANPETGEVLDPKTTPEFYTLDAIRNSEVWTPENVKSEYQRLYKIVSRRMKAIEASEIGRESKTYHYNKDKFKPASQLKPYEQKIMLAEAARMITAKTGTLSGIKAYREKAIKTFQRHGYSFVTKETFSDFASFMQMWKDSRFKGYGSEVATEVYQHLQDATAFESAWTKDYKASLVFHEFKKWQSEQISEQRTAENKRTGKKRPPSTELSSGQLLEMLDEFLNDSNTR